VRERGKEGNYYLNVTYRDFTPEMLHSLIMHSKQCSQYIKYECNSAPLRCCIITQPINTNRLIINSFFIDLIILMIDCQVIHGCNPRNRDIKSRVLIVIFQAVVNARQHKTVSTELNTVIVTVKQLVGNTTTEFLQIQKMSESQECSFYKLKI
jgi:hypothetical protein